MKLPFTIKLGAVKGVFARLSPSRLIPTGILAKVRAKLPSKLGGTKKGGEDDSDEGLGDDEDMFGDLGDLDVLDATAAARQRGEEVDEGDEEGETDYSSDDYTTDNEVDLDHLTSNGDVVAPEETQFADLDAEVPEGAGGDDGGIDLSGLEAMPDFEDDEGEDEEAETAAKKKKLLMIAAGGVAAAVLIGAASWLLMGGDGADSAGEPEIVDLSLTHNTVVSLENIPMASQEVPGAAQHTPAQAAGGGLMPPSETPEGAAHEQPDGMSDEDRTLAQLGLNVAQEPGVGVVVPSVTKASYANISHAPAGKALSVAPVATLVEQTDVGILPKIAEDGLTAYDAYARPEPQLDAAKPKIAIVVTGLGLSRAATEAALAAMPQDVTLSLDIYARGLDFWVARAREDGHEVLLSLPLESANFPFTDPGPEALRVLNAREENVQKLEYILSRTTGYFGVLADRGGKFLTVEDQVDTVMQQLKARGLMYVDGGAPGSLGTRSAYKLNIPWAAVEVDLDQAQGRAALDRQLQELADLAQKRAIAIARVSATPLSMQQLGAWLTTLDQQGFQLVPVSALANKQLIR